MSLIKSVARNLIFPFLVSSKSVKLLTLAEHRQTLIVMFHGVVPEVNFSFSTNHLSVVSFERQIQYLKKNFKVIKLQEAFDLNRTGRKQEDLSVVITFDDGYANNFEYAFPILKKYNVPATIFTVTSHLIDPRFVLWYDFVDFSKNIVPLQFFIDRVVTTKGADDADNIKTWNDLKTLLKSFTQQEKESMLSVDELLKQRILADVPKEFFQLLNTQQMKVMVDSGLIEMGSHTHSHPNLDILKMEDAKYELEHSKRILQTELNYEVTSIAFPDGAYNEKVKELSLGAGYKNLLAVDYKLPSDKSDINILPRYCISNTTTSESNIVQIYNSFRKKGF